MGNRAVVTDEGRSFGMYVHWNGGRDSIEPLLESCEEAGYPGLSEGGEGFARMCQTMCNFFGSGGLSCGIFGYPADDRSADPGDNGIYVVDGWDIADRIVHDGFEEQESHSHDEMAEEFAGIISRASEGARFAKEVEAEMEEGLIVDGVSGIGLLFKGGADRRLVGALLEYCRMRDFRMPAKDDYGWARLCQVVGNCLPGKGSVRFVETPPWEDAGLLPWEEALGEGSHGFLLDGWGISLPFEGDGDAVDKRLLRQIDDAQPFEERLGRWLDSPTVGASDIEEGDLVFIRGVDGRFNPFPVVGFGKSGMVVNGTDVSGLPMFDIYGNGDAGNINNYLREKEARVLTEEVRLAWRGAPVVVSDKRCWDVGAALDEDGGEAHVVLDDFGSLTAIFNDGCGTVRTARADDMEDALAFAANGAAR